MESMVSDTLESPRYYTAKLLDKSVVFCLDRYGSTESFSCRSCATYGAPTIFGPIWVICMHCPKISFRLITIYFRTVISLFKVSATSKISLDSGDLYIGFS